VFGDEGIDCIWPNARSLGGRRRSPRSAHRQRRRRAEGRPEKVAAREGHPSALDAARALRLGAAGAPLINDPTNRVYRGPDPSLLPRDRVEAVHFSKVGRYLVICGVVGHFTAGMFAFVRVLR
jgi:hypothetical protein